MKFRPKQFYIVLLGLIGLVIIGGGAGYYLSHQSLSAKIVKLEHLQADIRVSQDQNKQLAAVAAEYATLGGLDAKLQRALPSDKLQSEVAAQLFAMIRDVKMSTDGLNFEATSGLPGDRTQTAQSDVAGVLVMPVTFSVNGSYSQLLALLDSIERQERLMQVQSLNIARGEGVLSFDLSVEVYLRP